MPCGLRWRPATTISGSIRPSAGSRSKSFTIPRWLGVISATRSNSAAGRFPRILRVGCHPTGPPIDPFSRPSRGCCVASRRWGGTMISGTCARSEIGCQPVRPDRTGTVVREDFRIRKRRRRDMVDFFDFGNFSALQGSADRDRTTAERDPKAEGVERHSRPLPRCRREGNRRSMSTGFARGFSVSLTSRTAALWVCRPRTSRLEARVL